MTVDFKSLARQYRQALTGDVIPFWLAHSADGENGGYFNCLDRRGSVYDTDKFMWLQGREIWTFAMLYNRLEPNPAWREMAARGAQFISAHGMDADGNWYFALDRQGNALVQPYNIFSDCFAAMGLSQYALAANNEQARTLAARTFANIVKRHGNPKGRFSKAGPAARPMQSLVLPMIMCNLALELEWLLPADEVERVLRDSVGKIMTLSLDRRRMLLFENVAPDGSHPDCFDGRLISPGHGIEACWFMMDAARRLGQPDLIGESVEISLRMLEYGWDQTHGGILYFKDAENKPLDRLDWDQKLWWVHLETLQTLLMGYHLTGRTECLDWFHKVHEWTWSHFPDPHFGEWFGYLNRRGEVLIDCKGGKWKCCFHVPRALYRCMRELEALSAQ